MSDAMIVDLISQALIQVLIVGGPILIVSMVVGLIVSIFQATTSIQEQTLTFVPKIVAIFFVIILFAGWMLNYMKSYVEGLFSMISLVGR